MLYQLGIILIIIVAAIIVSKRFNNKTDLVYEDEMDDDCLLYTSPSPRDRTRSRMPSSA